jgi:thiamine biosynthesis lipoprotein
MAHRSWRALGTYVHVTVDDPHVLDAAERLARDVLAEVDRTCSRFRTDSDLARVNRSPGVSVPVDRLLVAAVRVAVEAARVSDGLVDPCLGRTLVSLGYDADLDVVRSRDRAPVVPLQPPRPGAWREVVVTDTSVRIPTGCALDLGSTAKAWASDLVATSIADELGCGTLVSLGGDIATAGPAAALAWPVAISEGPDDPAEQLVGLGGGGLATSSSRVRRWTSGDVDRHHLVDPRTGRPATGPWRTVTATGPTCIAANTASTAAIVLGYSAVAWLSERGVDARLVDHDGHVHTTGRWPAQREKATVA